MVRFLLVRVLQSIPVLFVMSMITFIIINAPPGDYGDYIRDNMITQGNASFAAADAAAERYREEHGLNDPLMVQYFRWITGIVTRGDFGWSYFYNRPGRRRWSASGCRARSRWRSPATCSPRSSASASASSPPPGSTAGSTPCSRSSRSSA